MNNVMEPPPAANGELARRESRLPAEVEDNSEFQNLLDSSRFAHLQRVATLFSQSQLVPEHFRGNVANCFIGLQMAMRMGIDPLMLFQNSYIVHGRPGIESKLAIALVNSSGLFMDSLDYEIQGGPDPFNQNYAVRCYATRKSTGKRVDGPWVNWKMVKSEGWENKQGSKWKTIPGLMFQYRAAMFFARLHCPERLMGMQTVDELHDAGEDRVMPAVTERGTKALLTKVRNATARPVSEGHVLEDIDTGAVIQEGEKTPEQETQAELRSHDFARPGADEKKDPEGVPDKAEGDVDLPQQAQTQQATAPSNDVGMSENEKWWVKVRELAGDMPEANLTAGVAHWRKANNLMPMKEHLAKPKSQKELFEAIQKREGGYFSVPQ